MLMFQKIYMFERTHCLGILQGKIHSEKFESVVILISLVKIVTSYVFSVKLKLANCKHKSHVAVLSYFQRLCQLCKFESR